MQYLPLKFQPLFQETENHPQNKAHTDLQSVLLLLNRTTAGRIMKMDQTLFSSGYELMKVLTIPNQTSDSPATMAQPAGAAEYTNCISAER